MDFSSDHSEQSHVSNISGRSPSIAFATDAEDDKFMHLLVRCTEQFILHQKLTEEEKHERQQTMLGQSALDDLRVDARRFHYCLEPSLAPVIQKTEADITAVEEFVALRRQALQAAESKLRRLQAVKHTPQLYTMVPRFVDRCIFKKMSVQDIDFTPEFCKTLSRLRARAEQIRQYRLQGTGLRRRTIEAHARVIASQNQRSEDVDEADLKTRRQRVLSAYRKQQELLKEREQNQWTAESEFFLFVVRPALEEANILPPQSPLTSPPRSASLSPMIAGDVQMREDHSGRGVSISSETVSVAPEREKLAAYKSAAARARKVLNDVQSHYVRDLGEHMVTYLDFTKDLYDIKYRAMNNGTSYETIEGRAQEAVLQADAQCQFAWESAVAAGVTDMPASPMSIGSDSDDGLVGTEGSKKRNERFDKAVKRRPEIQAWIGRVARGGSPVSPSLPPNRVEKSRAPRGNVRPSWPWEEGDPVVKRSRIDRYGLSQKEMERKYEKQAAARLAREAWRAARSTSSSASRSVGRASSSSAGGEARRERDRDLLHHVPPEGQRTLLGRMCIVS